ncbi:hypothetical protein [Isoalcanivorax beigongshangi]|uniref:ABC transporter permease n=1 Tax=Isoalcanivorax beigongshangi TaxID=3238810 RepID=A0ABV4ACR2_9GAMM
MSNVLPFRKPRAPKKGLCQHGFHRWKVVKETVFDTKEGKLVTRFQCERCGKTKVEAK